jgi:hypothetical protein
LRQRAGYDSIQNRAQWNCASMTRRRLSPATEAGVLVGSRRRCCICFGLGRDVGVKRGQIAHLDRDSSNDSVGNLAFLCLRHHDEYDSTTSQSKNFTPAEVRSYRDELHRSVIPASQTRASSTAPPREVGQLGGTRQYELRRDRERKTALLERLLRSGAVHSLLFLAHELGLSARTTERLLFDLEAEGAVRIDRQTGTLKKTYSVAASEENRLVDTFVASLGGGVVSETRHIRRREFELDAVVTTPSATYAVETLVARDRISEQHVRSRIGYLDSAKLQMGLIGSKSVLLIGISDATVIADADLKHLEGEGILVKYIELGPGAATNRGRARRKG